MGLFFLNQPKAPILTSSLTDVLQQSYTTKYQMALVLASQPTASAQAYTVQAGDTLQSIAQQHGLSPRAIVQASPEPIDFLKPGQTLALPKREGFIWPIVGPTMPAATQRTSLDLVAPMGTEVVAAQAGTVITAGQKYNGYGNMVEIRHNDGIVTRYAHGSRILVQAGQRVTQGEPVLSVGCSGQCSRAHVRFEVRVKGRTVDPLTFLP